MFLIAVVQVTLSSEPNSLVGQLCPGNVQFTCSTTRLPTLRWFSNNEQIVVHSHNIGASYPRVIATSGKFSNLTVTVLSAMFGESNDVVNFISTLDTDLSTLSALQAQNISCGSLSVTQAKAFVFTLKGYALAYYHFVSMLHAFEQRSCAQYFVMVLEIN